MRRPFRDGDLDLLLRPLDGESDFDYVFRLFFQLVAVVIGFVVGVTGGALVWSRAIAKLRILSGAVAVSTFGRSNR